MFWINLLLPLVGSLASASNGILGDQILELGPTRLLFGGHPMIDISCHVKQDVVDELGFRKGESNRITPEVFRMLGERVKVESRYPGGSSAVTARAYGFVGGDASFFGYCGDDELCDVFVDCLNDYGVHSLVERRKESHTSQIYCLITPDAERTMYLLFGASHLIHPESLPASVMDEYDFYVINGFIFGTPGIIGFTHAMVDAALARGKRLITLLANSVCIRLSGKYLKPIADKSAYISGNIEEYLDLYEFKEREPLFRFFEERTSGETPQHVAVIITLGEEGAYIICKGERHFVPAPEVVAVDTTGAGDFFAGATLYGLLNGYTVQQAGAFGAAMAGDIIGHMGAVVTDGLRAKIDAMKAEFKK
ncbi:ribokinase like protein [Babesia gibsoni]|uniref:Ribokinase like protein n=1 Tax=Babesia gibsoni TaxID=33632 RepID=A0AAD8LPX5_BABGI|nr:ribokinase like protein [Babesia gibsoni]